MSDDRMVHVRGQLHLIVREYGFALVLLLVSMGSLSLGMAFTQLQSAENIASLTLMRGQAAEQQLYYPDSVTFNAGETAGIALHALVMQRVLWLAIFSLVLFVAALFIAIEGMYIMRKYHRRSKNKTETSNHLQSYQIDHHSMGFGS